MTLRNFLDQFRALHSPNPTGDDAPARDESAGTGRFATAEECRQYLPERVLNGDHKPEDFADLENFSQSIAAFYGPSLSKIISHEHVNRKTEDKPQSQSLFGKSPNRATLEFLQKHQLMQQENFSKQMTAFAKDLLDVAYYRWQVKDILREVRKLIAMVERATVYCSCGRRGTKTELLGLPASFVRNSRGYWTCGRRGHSQMKGTVTSTGIAGPFEVVENEQRKGNYFIYRDGQALLSWDLSLGDATTLLWLLERKE